MKYEILDYISKQEGLEATYKALCRDVQNARGYDKTDFWHTLKELNVKEILRIQTTEDDLWYQLETGDDQPPAVAEKIKIILRELRKQPRTTLDLANACRVRPKNIYLFVALTILEYHKITEKRGHVWNIVP